jgi:hypothetical protein
VLRSNGRLALKPTAVSYSIELSSFSAGSSVIRAQCCVISTLFPYPPATENTHSLLHHYEASRRSC